MVWVGNGMVWEWYGLGMIWVGNDMGWDDGLDGLDGWMDGYDADDGYDVTVSFLSCLRFVLSIFFFLFLYYNEVMQGHVGSSRAPEP